MPDILSIYSSDYMTLADDVGECDDQPCWLTGTLLTSTPPTMTPIVK